eukprot:gnl/MRDRNA2_/MRDRNA2_96129_c0_seq1.p1 gnl/MRDRNA2_/MRDRNA2_96129_c0~~gnl/MRDRNA2_/MRDRNA2_96129_c0_seq1.p1  ORF type:complete len:386 (+),score=88.72 gnl/MRDRNA2_/MRDRNA2_96129_c0_seq1:53-1210(+)
MARPRQRLSLYPEPAPGDSPGAHREYNAAAGGPQNFTAQKSQVLKRLAETLVELDKTEALHFDALFEEEQHARQRYIHQFQSIAGKVQQLSEELEVDRSFRQEYHSAIARYTQEQSQEIEGFAQDMVQLRDLEHMVRGHLPVQLEALAALAHDIQVELRQKADMNATKSRLTQINQRLARLEEVIETKASRSELEAQQERMAAIIPDRNRLARCFELIAPAIREPSSRPKSEIKVSGPSAKLQGTPAKAKSKSSGKGLHPAESDIKGDRKGSMLPAEEPSSPRPSTTQLPRPSKIDDPGMSAGVKSETTTKAKQGGTASMPKQMTASAKLSTPAAPPPVGHEGKAGAPPPAEGKAAPQPKSHTSSKAPAARPKDEGKGDATGPTA